MSILLYFNKVKTMSGYSTDASQSAVQDRDSMMAQSNQTAVPDLVKIGQIPSNTLIDIETDVLDPVVQSQTFCRFQLQNKGILHSHSKLIFRIASSSTSAFFPVGVGVHSLVSRCLLKVGTRTLSEIDDYAHYMGYKSMFMSNEHQKERELFTSGRGVAHKVYYNDGQNASFVGQSDTNASFIGLDCGVYPNGSGVVMDTGGDVKLRPVNRTDDTIGGPEYQIALADLFPFLYTNQLPLYMMKEPVTIELHFNGLKDRLVRTQGEGNVDFNIDTTATQLYADYQYFPQEMMEQYAQQNATMTFSYVDYRLAKRSVSSSASGSEVATGETIMNVGGAGRICSKLICMLSCDDITNVNLLGNYHSFGMMRDYTNATQTSRFNGSLTANVKYNDKFLYPKDIDNVARLFHETQKAEGMVPFVTREEYSNEGEAITPVEFEGYDQNSNLNGVVNKFFYQAFHLNRGERVNSRGIEYYFNYDKLQGGIVDGSTANNYTLRVYVEIMRMATLSDGMITTFFA